MIWLNSRLLDSSKRVETGWAKTRSDVQKQPDKQEMANQPGQREQQLDVEESSAGWRLQQIPDPPSELCPEESSAGSS